MDKVILDDSSRIVITKPKLNEFHKEFIATYEQCPVLWDTKHVHYSNQIERAHAYDRLVQILRKVDPGATRECVKKQINSLRSNYRRLLRRHLASKVLIDGEEVFRFIPTSWKFYALRFLDTVENLNNLSMKDETENTIVEEDVDNNSSYENVRYIDSPHEYKIPKKQKRKSEPHHEYEFVTAGADVSSVSNQEFEAVGTNVSYKLRRMTDDQRHIAELLINKILICGLRNQLCDVSDLTGLITVQHCDAEEEDRDVAEVIN